MVKVLNRRTGKSQQEVKAIVDEMVQTARKAIKPVAKYWINWAKKILRKAGV